MGHASRRLGVRYISFAALTAMVSLLSATGANADQPVDWQVRFQPAATGIMQEITWFEIYTLWFIVPITLLVLGLLAYCAIKFRKSANPVPSRTSHNTLIEVVWTVAPVVILLAIAVPSFQLLSAQYDPPEEAALTIKATGYQWYWGYEYQAEAEEGGEPTEVVFDSFMLQDADREAAGKTDVAAYPRLLAVDNEVVVPVNQTVRLLITAGDVLHSFAMPAFGVKMDAVPGRLNETWFKAEREGLYYGQCSELCGKDHAFMPIAIRVVSEEQYNSWATAAAANVGEANRALIAAIEAEKSVDVAENDAQ
ncbi:cytochrome c oxidase subunit II [Georhizobium profundi]|uniref:Cytochrome c oxidase subunit 2 n=1 Tax=Georhizobium profundi TaxID=2341112 RepID=A0A3Q8XSN9_9HYPH|nr:cytochrome c oxidase subunit II [Georhizobium profundi]